MFCFNPLKITKEYIKEIMIQDNFFVIPFPFTAREKKPGTSYNDTSPPLSFCVNLRDLQETF